MSTSSSSPLDQAVDEIGLTKVATACSVTHQAVRKWQRTRLPRTEWTGETVYAATIERLSGGKYTKAQLLGQASNDPDGAHPSEPIQAAGGEAA